ncbi:hypothetical protein Q8A73_002987 [Channa argus]|nr:hypothetical protein Q8A73_002987 [Channa argus]
MRGYGQQQRRHTADRGTHPGGEAEHHRSCNRSQERGETRRAGRSFPERQSLFPEHPNDPTRSYTVILHSERTYTQSRLLSSHQNLLKSSKAMIVSGYAAEIEVQRGEEEEGVDDG